MARGLLFLFEYLLCKHGEIYTPVAPDVTTVGLYIFIFIPFAVPVVAQVDCALIQEVGLTHTHPVELGLATEELSTLLRKIWIIFNLLSKRILVTTICQMQTCRELSEIVELVRIEQTYVECVSTTH